MGYCRGKVRLTTAGLAEQHEPALGVVREVAGGQQNALEVLRDLLRDLRRRRLKGERWEGHPANQRQRQRVRQAARHSWSVLENVNPRQSRIGDPCTNALVKVVERDRAREHRRQLAVVPVVEHLEQFFFRPRSTELCPECVHHQHRRIAHYFK